jgi:CHAT domain-containing protein
VWDPVSRGIGKSSLVLVVPDGSINLLSLATLPDSREGYLVESGPTFHYLSAERDLARPGRDSPGRGLLAIGGVDFDGLSSEASAPSQAQVASSAFRGNRSACESFRKHRFERLPATELEIAGIESLWVARGKSEDRSCERLSGSRAAEDVIKQTVRGKDVLHFATHGFFLGGECSSALSGDRGIGGLSEAKLGTPPPVLGENPLLLSGLALAGANRRGEAVADRDDGVLTAEEIAALDLRGVSLAVLSACQTGVGELRAGEGVLGIRRAFEMAGARSLVMSLWSVEDESTRQWMMAFYAARQKRGIAEAARAASRDLMRRKKGDSRMTPFRWGAFVSTGDWR